MKLLILRNRKILALVLSFSVWTCLAIGLAIYGKWLDSEIQSVVRKQTLDDNIQIARQLTRLIREMELEDIRDDPKSWDRLQSVVEQIQLPNAGFVCVVESDSGQLICHPMMRSNMNLKSVAVGKSPIEVDGQQTRIIDYDTKNSSFFGGMASIGGENQVVAVSHLQELDANLLVHQRESGLLEACDRITAPVERIGLIVATLISLVTALLASAVLKRYECFLESMNAKLETQVQQRTASLLRTRDAVVFGLAKLAESRDTDTGQHLERIQLYVTCLAEELQSKHDSLTDQHIADIALASSLHDIGKVGIPDRILLKPGRFEPHERTIMEKHAALGGECLVAIQEKLGEDDFLHLAKEIAYAHHEKWDGSGYPFGIQGSKIPLSARLVALADVYDALTSKRPYKDPMSHEKARRIILEGRGTHFDPQIVDAFLSKESEFAHIAESNRQGSDQLAPVAALSQQAVAEPSCV